MRDRRRKARFTMISRSHFYLASHQTVRHLTKSLCYFRSNWLTLYKRCQEYRSPVGCSLLDLETGERRKRNTSCKHSTEAAWHQKKAGEPQDLGLFICVLASRGLCCGGKPMKIHDDIPFSRKITHTHSNCHPVATIYHPFDDSCNMNKTMCTVSNHGPGLQQFRLWTPYYCLMYIQVLTN